MRSPEQRKEGKKTFIPVIPPHLLKYMTKFYEKLHALDIKYTTIVYSTVQKYTVLRIASKVIGKLSDGPALPFLLLLYYIYENPAPLTFAAYTLFWVFYHEFGIKHLFQRHRPNTAGKQKGFSFPSSHSFASGLLIVACIFFVLPYKALLIAFGLLNVINRPASGVHYIADVVAGMLLGAIAGLGWPLILRIAMVTLP